MLESDQLRIRNNVAVGFEASSVLSKALPNKHTQRSTERSPSLLKCGRQGTAI
jgi:hypothetical protein